MLSKTLKEMKENNEGFRTENYSGSLVRELHDIIVFEISELGNTDIVTYVQEHYNILDSYSLSDEFKSNLKKVHPNNYIDEYNNKFAELCQKNSQKIATEIIEFVVNKLETSPESLIGLWLSTYNNVRTIYNSNVFENINKYPLYENEYLVLSDLDREGSLFAVKREIEKSKKENIHLKFYDTQTGRYSAHTTIEGLFEMLCEGYCECGEGYDVYDKKDDSMKCINCKRLNNLESISEEEMKDYIEQHEYLIEYN